MVRFGISTGGACGAHCADFVTGVVGQADSTTVAAAVASVLPPGLFPNDERLEAVASVLAAHDDTGKVAALLTGQPYTPRKP